MFATLLSRRRWLLAIVLSVGLAACGGSGDDDPPPPPPPTPPAPVAKADTTLLVYTLGSDLESAHGMASLNIQEMRQATPSDRVNVVLTTGGADKDDWRTVRRQVLRNQNLEVLEDLGQVNMADPATLTEFIEWGIKTYPAERYLLVFWNHGGGPNGGFGGDENFPDEDGNSANMSLPAIQQALRDAATRSGAHFDLIGFDACLMASVEIAQALAPHANYLLASEEVEPGPGWNWTTLLQTLSDQPGISSAELGRTMIDAYMAKMASWNSDGIATLSIVDLSKIAPLVASLERFTNALSARLTDEGNDAWFDIAYARRNAADFTSGRFFGAAFDLVDIGDLVIQPQLLLPEHHIADVQRALEAAVVYQRYGADRIPTNGLSLYFPVRSLHSPQTLATYDAQSFSPTIRAFITRYAEQVSQLPPTTLGTPVQRGDQIEATLSQSALSPFAAMVNEDGIVYAMKPADGTPDFDPENPDQRRIAALPEGQWFGLGGHPVLLLPDERQYTVDRGRFSIPVAIYSDEDDTDPDVGFLEVKFEQEEGQAASYQITSFSVDYGNNSVVAARPIQFDDKPFLLRLLALEQDENGLWGQTLHDTDFIPGGNMRDDWQLEILEGLPGPREDFRLGVIDFVSKPQLSPALP